MRNLQEDLNWLLNGGVGGYLMAGGKVKKVAQYAIERAMTLENAIKTHRSQLADDRCIEDDDRLYEALGDGIKCDRRVGNPKEMLRNCKRFIRNRCESGGWPTYQELLEENKKLKELLEVLLRIISRNY